MSKRKGHTSYTVSGTYLLDLLYRGLALNWIKTAPNVAIYMSLYDTVKAHLLARAGGGADEHPCNRKSTVL